MEVLLLTGCWLARWGICLCLLPLSGFTDGHDLPTDSGHNPFAQQVILEHGHEVLEAVRQLSSLLLAERLLFA